MGSSNHPAWFDPALPAREDCVLPALLERAAQCRPHTPLALFEDGSHWSCAEALAHTRSAAATLVDLGVGAGDHVLAWLPNGPAMLTAWFASNYLGAVLVPINTSYRGRMLQHVVNQSGAKLMLGHSELLPRLRELDCPALEQIVSCSGDVPAEQRHCAVRYHPEALLHGNPTPLLAAQPVERWDTMMIIYTSGTTGPSKGVKTTYLQQYTVGQVCFGYLGAADRMLVNLPLFHVGGTTAVVAALATGGSFALFEKFSTERFWEQIRNTGATAISGLLGAMVAFLDKNEAAAADANNPLQRVVLSPVTRQTLRLAERYNFDYFSGFNMTELSVPLVTDLNTRVLSSCGRPRSGVECRIVDEHDLPLPAGEIGEFVLRTDLPWALNQGYYGMPEASLAAWRNGWFHTGDLMYRDADDNYFFVDRKKDAIRRRGENISSIEVEAEVAEYPAVAEVAAFGVASEFGEDEVMVAVAPKTGQHIEPRALAEFLLPRMTHFMIPRYIRVMPELPKTPTNKIQKHGLREEGVSPDTWDRTTAGLTVSQQTLQS